MHILIKSSELPPLQIVIHITCILYMQELRARQVSYLFRVIQIVLFIWFMGFSSKNTEVVCHSILQWTIPCQSPPPWPICFEWPYTAWLIASLSLTRLWSMWSDWLVSCDSGFQSVCSLMKKGKRLMEASWWERLIEGEIGSCSEHGRDHVQ